MYLEIDDLIQVMHDSLCACGGHCFGWEDDRAALIDFIENRWGSVAVFNRYLRELG